MEKLAGSRDSDLTSHGMQQALRLGEHIANSGVKLTHVFSSPLQRAYKTADALRVAQVAIADVAQSGEATTQLAIIRAVELVEQDFGFYEGKSFNTLRRDSSKTGREACDEKHKSGPDFVGVESKDSMAKRSNIFLDKHLVPVFACDRPASEPIVAIISHGILLGNLWRCLLRRLPANSVNVTPEVLATHRRVTLEHLGGWANTGYLELSLQKRKNSEVSSSIAGNVHFFFDDEGAADGGPLKDKPVDQKSESRSETLQLNSHGQSFDIDQAPERSLVSDNKAPHSGVPVRTTEETLSMPLSAPITKAQAATDTQSKNLLVFEDYTTTIVTINGKDHLMGLKRTRGGIGRSKFDKRQKTLDMFFKQVK
ncbi:hypothetical protein LTR66_008799 [Elasticomyces elasticus]|nr:hypothetical protein LTR66_008799 [Elasticomyces elasticus]